MGSNQKNKMGYVIMSQKGKVGYMIMKKRQELYESKKEKLIKMILESSKSKNIKVVLSELQCDSIFKNVMNVKTRQIGHITDFSNAVVFVHYEGMMDARAKTNAEDLVFTD